MADLRSPAGCAWDREQTHASLRGYLIEETYEALDAIDRGDLNSLRGELGDVLLQCVFHAQLASEAGNFTIGDVVSDLVAKLIRRHPHVFADDGHLLSPAARARQSASTPGAVRDQWARLKAREQAAGGEPARVLAGVVRALPALARAQKIGGRAADVGFDWRDAAHVLTKVDEEVAELRAAMAEGGARVEEELGDLLFATANLARKLDLDAERALSRAADKFTRRFDAVEARLDRLGRSVHDASNAELEEAWEAVKAEERTAGPPAVVTAPSTSSPARSGRRIRRSSPRPDRS
jgi:ATP diphosphatase